MSNRKIEPITDPERLEQAYRKAKASAEVEGHLFIDEDERVIKTVLCGDMARKKPNRKIERAAPIIKEVALSSK